ncbi:putative pumilio homolog 10 isoform X2 [Oryza brachyantha]|uniref:putative pumilio homolog 10 isoform X2 n=1 Tax=Oryza brachyantha TaxID=4533 RepID=UPI001ADA3E4D|nr:putative pumilio homolog 10 isoform X2 [Oryza brachyantha]
MRAARCEIGGCPVAEMEELPDNQEDPRLSAYCTDKIADAIFADHVELGSQYADDDSSPEAGWVPMAARRQSQSQPQLGSSRLGVFLENDNFSDDQSLASAFKNMSLALRDCSVDIATNPFNPFSIASIAPMSGRYSASRVNSSADSMMNPSHRQDALRPSSLNINVAEYMEPKYGVRNVQMYTGLHGSDYVSGDPFNRPSASPLHKQYFLDGQLQANAPYQQMGPNFGRQDTDAERHYLLQSQCAYQQMPQVAGSDVHWIRSNQHGFIHSPAIPASGAPTYLGIPKVDQPAHGSADAYWNGAAISHGNNQLNSTFVNNCSCIIYPDCSREICNYCQIKQAEKLNHRYGLRRSSKGFLQHQFFDKFSIKSFPGKTMMKSGGINSMRNIQSGLEPNGCIEMNQIIAHHGDNQHLNIQGNDLLRLDWPTSQALSPMESEYGLAMKTAQMNFSSVDEVVGKIHLLAKDQNGCRFLQRIFTEGTTEDVKKVFDGIIEHTAELVVDPFGNYLVQKLLEECNHDQKMHIIYEITKRPGQLIKFSCDMHGTRVVQKVIETINSPDEVSMVVCALSSGAITLMMDANGCHVALRCLQKFSHEHKAFLLDAAMEYYFELAEDRQGCCIIQKCILHANKEQKNQLLYNITSRALELSEHQYGNYVIQYILDLRISWATDEILNNLAGHYGYLSMQKSSSNVVEKCLREAAGPERVKIIHELVNDPKLLHILIDPYGNYVIQTALKECEDAAGRAVLIGAIRPHVAALRNNMFGKRILSKTYLKNRKY